ncbi:DEAD-box ATP-dependent RNA helicase 28 [Tanacetum coccineum]
MESGFSFEPPSDEEIDYEDINSDVEVDEETSDVEQEDKGKLQNKTQSPWDFSSYTESVADEHARRSTTSIDEKISKFVQQRKPADIVQEKDDDDEDDDDDPEPDRQENLKDFQPEEDDEVPTTAGGRDNKSFFSKADGVSFNANSFMDLHLSRPLIRACEALGYTKPTPIQAACIPLALTGRDICGSAITGSGKTAAFALPTLERLLFRPKHRPAIRVLILTPTRELAVQIHSMIGKLAQFITDIRSCLVLGGLSMKAQEASLRSLPDIVVATPGRMIDHLRNSMSVDLDDLAVLILDEADRLLELGFDAEIRELVRLCPKRRQTMLFSATMTEQVDELIKLLLDKPLRLSADPTTKRPSTLTEEVVRIRRTREGNHEAVLLALCSKTFTSKVIIFSGTKQAAHRLKILFGLAGFKAAELHGNLTQAQRLDALELFRRQEADFLIATNVAARGLDIIGVQTVINYECPRDLTRQVKRAGSKLKSRIVAEQSITKWSRQIEQMEDQVASILREEREEMALRKAEMEAVKAENMITHRDEIFSRPKRTWFVTEKEKKLVANAGKTVCHGGDFSKHNLFRMLLLEMLTEDFPQCVSFESEKGSRKKVMSAEEAEERKKKEKKKREHERNLPRKKRRKLEASREMLEDEAEAGNIQGNAKNNKEKSGISLVDLAYRRAKAAKGAKKAADAGKVVRKEKKGGAKRSSHASKSRPEEMKELFQGDMSEKKQKRTSSAGGKKSSSFKSKSRYKRRVGVEAVEEGGSAFAALETLVEVAALVA